MVYKLDEEIQINRAGSEPEQVKWYYIVPSVSFGVVILVVILLLARKCARTRSQRKLDSSSSVFTSMETDINSAEYIYRHVYQNHRNPIYLVPYSALPENFDFSRPDITVRGDYIILKDLHVLEQPVIRPPSTPTTPTTPPASIIYFSEGYQKQTPYNPNFY